MAEASGNLSSNKLLALLRESRWLLLVACALYIALALYGYNRADPAWSHSASSALTDNPGGVLGAHLSDLLFYLFGFSAWWRSEEHTSELQSQSNLVCRLLLLK